MGKTRIAHYIELMDENIVEHWLKFNPIRLIAGLVAGIFAGCLAVLVAMAMATVMGYEIWFPIKYLALPLVGSSALDYGLSIKSFLAGFVTMSAICGFFGFVFGHFVYATRIPALAGMGFTWAIFSWVFLNNLFSPSFRDIFVIQFSSWSALFICLTYGMGLVSVRFFDRALRGKTEVY